jgi:hypothetical protein
VCAAGETHSRALSDARRRRKPTGRLHSQRLIHDPTEINPITSASVVAQPLPVRFGNANDSSVRASFSRSVGCPQVQGAKSVNRVEPHTWQRPQPEQ